MRQQKNDSVVNANLKSCGNVMECTPLDIFYTAFKKKFWTERLYQKYVKLQPLGEKERAAPWWLPTLANLPP